MLTPFESRIAMSPDVLVRQVGEESVLLDLKSERYLGLDDVSARFWQVLTTAESVQAACDVLAGEFDVEPARLRGDLNDFVQELLELGLVQLVVLP